MFGSRREIFGNDEILRISPKKTQTFSLISRVKFLQSCNHFFGLDSLGQKTLKTQPGLFDS